MEYKVYEWYSLARFDKEDRFIYEGCGDDYETYQLTFDTIEEAKEYLDDMIEPDGVVILRETRQIVC